MTAQVNLRTGKIVGCEKGSFAWYHEQGHLEYDNSEIGIRNGVNQNIALYCSLMFIVGAYLFDILKVFATISVIYLIYLVIYEEMWCNKYAGDKLTSQKKTKRFK